MLYEYNKYKSSMKLKSSQNGSFTVHLSSLHLHSANLENKISLIHNSMIRDIPMIIHIYLKTNN